MSEPVILTRGQCPECTCPDTYAAGYNLSECPFCHHLFPTREVVMEPAHV